MGNVDSIPIVSQVKSLVQVISGDVEGARETQENFRDTAPVVSQVTSLIHAINGDPEKAREVQEKFAKSLDELTDGLPIVGHIKGGVYYAMGDDERGEATMKGATGSLVSMAAGAAGFAAGGPAGAAAASLAASHAYDGLVTGVDTAIHGVDEDGSPRYYGSLDAYDNIAQGEASAGDIFDAIAMPAIDVAAGALGAKFGKGGKGGKAGGGIRCRRDIEYHLTPEEADFAVSHQRLPGSVNEVLRANWQHLNTAQTVSSLVSLFIILRLILWNDKTGRSYSRELCTLTEYYNVEKCQDALMKTLQRMDDHLATKKEDPEYVLNPTLEMLGITNNSTILMVRLMATMYGILDSIGRGDSIGVTWIEELCMFEQLDTYKICEDEVLHKLNGLVHKASYLGDYRKERIKRGAKCGAPSTTGAKKPPGKNGGSGSGTGSGKGGGGTGKGGKTTGTSKTDKSAGATGSGNGGKDLNIGSDDVGKHSDVQKYNRDTKNTFQGEHESNHVPARSSYPNSPPAGQLPAHSLPYDVHQIAMGKVGTSGSSHLAQTLRHYESQLIKMKKMAQAVKLDFVASYGRANALVNTGNFKPALVYFKTDLQALVNTHLKQGRISIAEAIDLHNFLKLEQNAWNAIPAPKMNNWFQRMELEYNQIVNVNHLMKPSLFPEVINVPQINYPFG